LDKIFSGPLNVSIAYTFNLIKVFKTEVKTIDKAIEKNIKGINTTKYQSLMSAPELVLC